MALGLFRTIWTMQLLQPAAKERQREAGEQFGKGAKLTADLREPIATPAEHRKSTAEAMEDQADIVNLKHATENGR